MFMIEAHPTETFLTLIGEPGIPKGRQERAADIFVETVSYSKIGTACIVTETYPKNPSPGTMSLMFMRTNLYVRLDEFKQSQAEVLISLCAALATGDATLAATAVAMELKIIARTVGRLDEMEAEAARRFIRLAGPSPFGTPISTEKYLSNWPSDEKETGRQMLENLRRKNLIEQGVDGWVMIK